MLFPSLHIPLPAGTWVVVDGLATRAYMPERMTQDVDIIIHSDDEPMARASFIAAGYTISGTLPIGGFSALAPDGLVVDVLLSAEPWLDLALAQPGRDAASFPVMPRPYLMLLNAAEAAGRPPPRLDRCAADAPRYARCGAQINSRDRRPLRP